jgi:hypothetical protein
MIEQVARGPRTGRVAEKREPVSEARGLTKEQLAARFRVQMYNNALPQLPSDAVPGFHLCWLSTTNKYDSIASREAMGYERVKPEEMPGFDHIVIKSGNFAGCIGHEEMVLFKLPLDLWEQYMTIAHHDRPFDEEERVRDVARYLKDIAREGGGDVYLGEGTQEIVNQRKSRTPTFSE